VAFLGLPDASTLRRPEQTLHPETAQTLYRQLRRQVEEKETQQKALYQKLI
jgi:hypothetical protein